MGEVQVRIAGSTDLFTARRGIEANGPTMASAVSLSISSRSSRRLRGFGAESLSSDDGEQLELFVALASWGGVEDEQGLILVQYPPKDCWGIPNRRAPESSSLHRRV